MQHAIAKLWPGKEQKPNARSPDHAERLEHPTVKKPSTLLSITSHRTIWAEKVYRNGILGNEESFYKKPSYTM